MNGNKKQLPTVSAIAVVKDIKATVPPPKDPSWKPRLKRVIYVEYGEGGDQSKELGTTYVCWGHKDLKIGIGGNYAFTLTVEQGNEIKFVNVVAAVLIPGGNMTPTYPDLPDENAVQRPATGGGSGDPTGKSRAIARSVALKEFVNLIVADKMGEARLAFGVDKLGIEGSRQLLTLLTDFIDSEKFPVPQELVK